MAEIKTLLDEVIETEISNLKTLPVEDERRGDAIRDLVSLHICGICMSSSRRIGSPRNTPAKSIRRSKYPWGRR